MFTAMRLASSLVSRLAAAYLWSRLAPMSAPKASSLPQLWHRAIRRICSSLKRPCSQRRGKGLLKLISSFSAYGRYLKDLI